MPYDLRMDSKAKNPFTEEAETKCETKLVLIEVRVSERCTYLMGRLRRKVGEKWVRDEQKRIQNDGEKQSKGRRETERVGKKELENRQS